LQHINLINKYTAKIWKTFTTVVFRPHSYTKYVNIKNTNPKNKVHAILHTNCSTNKWLAVQRNKQHYVP